MPRTVKFKIYRYDPDKDKKPYMQDLTVELKDTDKMLLDALQRIKADVDDTLSLRRSCREGVAGQRLPRRSCSRSIDSKSALKLPLPKPSEPCRSMISKKTVGRSPSGLVKICSR